MPMKYVPSALIGRLSRSAGSTTAAHNRFGAYLRNRVIPTNPASAKQTAVRNSLATFSGEYRALTDAQRAAWTALGLNMTRTDSLGQVYTLTGLQAYISLNRNLYTSGATSSIADAPAWAPPAGPLTLTATIAPA